MPLKEIEIKDAKVNRMIWGTVGDYIITGHEDGQLRQYDYKTGLHDSGNTIYQML